MLQSLKEFQKNSFTGNKALRTKVQALGERHIASAKKFCEVCEKILPGSVLYSYLHIEGKGSWKKSKEHNPSREMGYIICSNLREND